MSLMQRERVGCSEEQAPRDQDLRRRVWDYFVLRNIAGVGSVQIDVVRGNVLLSGIVPSSWAKRRYYECCRHVAKVINVVDRLIVDSGDSDRRGRLSCRGTLRRPAISSHLESNGKRNSHGFQYGFSETRMT